MLDVVIVDDKRTIREGLKSFIDWDSLGYRIAGDFSNAAAALQFMGSNKVDVLITDIVMPDMSGLELTRQIKAVDPSVKVIVLSAYEEFEYAQEVIRLGAVDYLTKPVDLEQLKAKLVSLKVWIDREYAERTKNAMTQKAMQEQFLNNLVDGRYRSQELILKRAEENGMCFPSGNAYVLRLTPEGTGEASFWGEENSQLHKTMLIAQLEESLGALGQAYFFNNTLTELCAILFADGSGPIKETLQQAVGELETSLDIRVFVGVGKPAGNLTELPRAYNQAGRALEYRIIKKNTRILFYDDVEAFFSGNLLITPEVEETIVSHLSLQSKDQLVSYVQELLSSVHTVSNADPSVLYDVCVQILLTINKFLTTNAEDKTRIEQSDYNSIKALLQKHGYEEIRGFMLHYLENCFSIIHSTSQSSSGLVIENAKKYINEHYREEITLKKLSKIVYVNPMYLSRLFKEKVGENFINYLTNVRIQKAKELLADPALHIYDITEMVGYESRNHFGKTFRDITGMSPREYRNSVSAAMPHQAPPDGNPPKELP